MLCTKTTLDTEIQRNGIYKKKKLKKLTKLSIKDEKTSKVQDCCAGRTAGCSLVCPTWWVQRSEGMMQHCVQQACRQCSCQPSRGQQVSLIGCSHFGASGSSVSKRQRDVNGEVRKAEQNVDKPRGGVSLGSEEGEKTPWEQKAQTPIIRDMAFILGKTQKHLFSYCLLEFGSGVSLGRRLVHQPVALLGRGGACGRRDLWNVRSLKARPWRGHWDHSPFPSLLLSHHEDSRFL